MKVPFNLCSLAVVAMGMTVVANRVKVQMINIGILFLLFVG